jgi:hypothetical protein
MGTWAIAPGIRTIRGLRRGEPLNRQGGKEGAGREASADGFAPSSAWRPGGLVGRYSRIWRRPISNMVGSDPVRLSGKFQVWLRCTWPGAGLPARRRRPYPSGTATHVRQAEAWRSISSRSDSGAIPGRMIRGPADASASCVCCWHMRCSCGSAASRRSTSSRTLPRSQRYGLAEADPQGGRRVIVLHPDGHAGLSAERDVLPGMQPLP